MPELVITVVIVVILAAIAVAVVAALRKRGLRKRLRLELVNLGNVSSRYELKAEEPTGNLGFEFTLDGDGLLESGVQGIGQVEGAAATPRQTTTPAPSDPGQPQKEKAQDPGEAKEKAGQAAAQAQEKAKLALTLGGAIADILGTLGMILPRSLGSPMLQAASRLRRGQSTATRVQQAPGRVGGQVKKVKSASKAAQQVSANPPVQSGTPQPSQQMPVTPAGEPQTLPASRALAAVPTAEPGWIQTPSVQPGETLAVRLLVTGPRLSQTQYYQFEVSSRSVEQAGSPVVSQTDAFRIRGIPWFLRVLPYLAIIAAAAAAIVYAVWVLNPGVLS
jgi:hypothetical protein